MRARTFALFLFCLAATGLGSCGDSAEAKELRASTARAWEDLKTYAIVQRDALVAATEEQLEELDARLDELDDKLDAAGEDLKVKVGELRVSASEKLAALERASAENWERAKAELGEALAELERATERLREH